jgi:hypothetical protein
MTAAKDSLHLKNDQLTSLHHVFSEMTETLTLGNIVKLTL